MHHSAANAPCVPVVAYLALAREHAVGGMILGYRLVRERYERAGVHSTPPPEASSRRPSGSREYSKGTHSSGLGLQFAADFPGFSLNNGWIQCSFICFFVGWPEIKLAQVILNYIKIVYVFFFFFTLFLFYFSR